MDSALAWIGKIAEWVGDFIPRREILDATEGAVKYVTTRKRRRVVMCKQWWPFTTLPAETGLRIVVCPPGGRHWWWPFTTRWVAYPVARQTDRLETQTMESQDGKTYMVGAMITYSVTNVEALITQNHSPSAAVIDIAMAAVHDICSEFTWERLQEEQRKGTLKTKLKNEAQRQLNDYGVKVIKLQLNTLARCRVLKVSQSTANEEN